MPLHKFKPPPAPDPNRVGAHVLVLYRVAGRVDLTGWECRRCRRRSYAHSTFRKMPCLGEKENPNGSTETSLVS